MKPTIKAFFDKDTFTLSYVVFDAFSRDAVILDTVWDYEPAGSSLSFRSCDTLLEFVKSEALRVHLIMETHAHADHLSGAQHAKQALPQTKVVIGKRICDVQKEFSRIYNLPDLPIDGSQFDVLLSDGETIRAGTLGIEAIFTPGHTPACASYVIGDAVFTGDCLFMPDFGTGRCDFPRGSASDLYDSVHSRLYKLPDQMRTFTAHDYQPGGRPLRYESTIGEQKQSNIHIKATTSKEEYVTFRTSRDATLSMPRLLLPSVQVNINAGHLPKPESNNVSYLKIPLH